MSVLILCREGNLVQESPKPNQRTNKILSQFWTWRVR